LHNFFHVIFLKQTSNVFWFVSFLTGYQIVFWSAYFLLTFACR